MQSNNSSDFVTLSITSTPDPNGYSNEQTKIIDLINRKQLIGYAYSSRVMDIANGKFWEPDFHELSISFYKPKSYTGNIELATTGTLIFNNELRIIGNNQFRFSPIFVEQFKLEFESRDTTSVGLSVKYLLTLFFADFANY